MLNIAIALAFIIAFFFSPGQDLLLLMIDKPLLNTLPRGQSGTIIAIFKYWLPALTIYMGLKAFPVTAEIKATKGEKIALTIGNFIIILYMVVRIFASTIPGGGAGFVVASYSIITALPALIIVGIALLKIAVRTLIRERQDSTAIHVNKRQIISYGLIGSIPVVIALGFIFIGENSLFNISRKTDQRLDELCKSAGEQILIVPNDVQSIYIEQDWGGQYKKIKKGIYQARVGSIIGERLVNSGYLRFFEKPAGMFLKKKHKDAKYQRYYSGKDVEPIDNLLSKYGVYKSIITNKDDKKFGTFGYDIVIKEIASGTTIAINRYFFNKKTRKICGHVDKNQISDRDFILKALKLERQFKSKGN